MKHYKKIILSLFIMLSTLVLVACQSSSYMESAIKTVDEEMADRGYEHEDIFQLRTSYEGVLISWESTDTIISSNGVVNAVGLNSDVEVTIIVTFKEGDNEEIRNYTVTVYHIVDGVDPDPDPDPTPDEAKIKLVKDNLNLPSTVNADITLITESNGVSISWASNHTAISNTGVVTRSETADVSVILTATFTSGTATDTKTFNITVSQINVLVEAKQALSIETTVSEDMTLPTTIGDMFVVNVTWSSDNSAISNTGVVTRSLTEDVTVTLTATLTYGSNTETKQFTVIVLKDPTLNDALEVLVIDEIVVRDLELVTEIGDVSVSWTSSLPNVISTTGVVVRPLSVDVSVTLTATLTYSGQTETKVFIVLVKVEPTQQLPTPVGFVWQADFGFFAYATYSPQGYSGSLQATFTANGQPTVTFTNASVGGQFSIMSILDQLIPGINYQATFIALGDGIDYADSPSTGPITFSVPIDFLDQPTNLVITEGVLTWDLVIEAEVYEVYMTIQGGSKTLLETLTSTDTLSITLPTAVGKYVIEVVAKADNRGDASTTIDFVVAAETLIVLDAPVITLNASNNTISWPAVTNADGYQIKVGELVANTTATTFDLIQITNTSGTYNVVVIAIGDGVNFSNSLSSNSVEYTINITVQKVDASGLLIQVNVAGHYSIENPASFNPVGWANGQYIVEIYQNGTLVRSKAYTNTSPVVHFQTPGDINGLLYGLTPGSYQAHFIMVGNGTTHINSDPKVFTFNYAG